MNWYIDTNHGDLDLEDCEIHSINRSEIALKIYLDKCNVAGTIHENPCLTFAAPYTENQASINSTEAPLNFIQVVEYTKNKLKLSGMLNNKPWYEWEIEFSTLEIAWSNEIAIAT